MEFIRSEGRIPTRRVYIRGITDETNEQILAFAMQKTGESKGSLFGWNVSITHPGSATVALYTD